MNDIPTLTIIKVLSVILFSILLYILLKKIITKIVLKQAKKNSNKKTLTMVTILANVSKYIIIIIDLLMILDMIGIDTKALLTSIGVVGIVSGLALQDLLKDIIAGTAILTEEQFRVGDNIKIGDFRGDVISLGLKTTKIKSYTGEVKIISNRNITEVTNYSVPSSKCILDIQISYEEDIEKIKKVLNSICNKLKKEEDYICGNVELLGVEALTDDSITLRVVAQTKQDKNIPFKRLFLEEIVKEFKKQDIKIPYPKMEVIHEK